MNPLDMLIGIVGADDEQPQWSEARQMSPELRAEQERHEAMMNSLNPRFNEAKREYEALRAQVVAEHFLWRANVSRLLGGKEPHGVKLDLKTNSYRLAIDPDEGSPPKPPEWVAEMLKEEDK